MARRTTAGDRRHAGGFTYLMLLWWVAISGVMLTALGQQWLLESRRQREAELVFRGTELGRALATYRATTPAGMPDAPQSVDELLEDRRGPQMQRHLRQAWRDPITGQPWTPLIVNGRILGFHSASNREPLRPPSGIERYDQWIFDASVAPSVLPAPPPAPSPPDTSLAP